MPIAKKIDSKKPAPEASSNMGEDFIVPLNGTPLSGKRHNGALPKDKVPKFGLDNEFIVKGKIIPDNNPFIFQVNLSETCMNAPRENGGQKIIGNANENNYSPIPLMLFPAKDEGLSNPADFGAPQTPQMRFEELKNIVRSLIKREYLELISLDHPQAALLLTPTQKAQIQNGDNSGTFVLKNGARLKVERTGTGHVLCVEIMQIIPSNKELMSIKPDGPEIIENYENIIRFLIMEKELTKGFQLRGHSYPINFYKIIHDDELLLKIQSTQHETAKKLKQSKTKSESGPSAKISPPSSFRAIYHEEDCKKALQLLSVYSPNGAIPNQKMLEAMVREENKFSQDTDIQTQQGVAAEILLFAKTYPVRWGSVKRDILQTYGIQI